jgi:hypothetical protein
MTTFHIKSTQFDPNTHYDVTVSYQFTEDTGTDKALLTYSDTLSITYKDLTPAVANKLQETLKAYSNKPEHKVKLRGEYKVPFSVHKDGYPRTFTRSRESIAKHCTVKMKYIENIYVQTKPSLLN